MWRHIVSDTGLQDLWEDRFVVQMIAGNGIKGSKSIDAIIHKDKVIYKVFDGLWFTGEEYASLADAVDVYNQL